VKHGLGALVAAAICLGAPSGTFAATDHTIIVVLDGIRASEGFDDPAHAHVPRMWNDLRPLGTWIPEFRNDGWTITNPGHASVLTGTWQYLANDGTQRPTSPTLFEFFRAATGLPASSAWVVTGKSKLDICSHSIDPAYGAPYGASIDCVNRTDPNTYAAFTGRLAADHPRVSLFHLADIDIKAHQSNWNGYLRAIEIADSLVYELWMAVESDPVLSGKTAMFVTCDHGRHDDAHGGFSNHGDTCLGCRRIPFLALGPDVAAGGEGTLVRTQRDIAPTIGALLGFPTPGVEGAVMEELWAPTAGVPVPATAAAVRVLPNPSSGPTRFDLPASAGRDTVRLRIWDLAGRLVYEERTAARAISWSGSDGHGRAAAAGAYYWEVSGAGIQEKGQLLIVK